VMFDVSVEHFSIGNMNGEYYRNLIKVYKKWEKKLPLIEHKISTEDLKNLVPKIEEKNLLRLIKKLIRAGFSTKETIDLITYYAYLINSTKAINRLKYLYFQILFIRVTSFIRKKNNY